MLNKISTVKKLVFGMLVLLHAGAAFAETRGIEAVPTGWRLESYGEKGVALWHTPSVCANGALGLWAGATLADHNRLYATVLAAKLAGVKMFIYYKDEAAGCTIISYGTDA